MKLVNRGLAALPVLILLALLAACGTTKAEAASPSNPSKPPRWYLSLEDEYPDAVFVAVVGSGDSRRAAEEVARGELAKRFKVKVVMTTQAEQRYREVVKGSASYGEEERNIANNVTSSADQTFVDVKFSDPFVDQKGRTSIVAFLNRKEASAQYKNMIDRDLKTVEGFVGRADKAESKLQALAMVDTAVQVANHADVLIAQLDVIDRTLARTYGGKSPTQDLLKRRDDIAKGISVAVIINGDADGKITALATTIMQDFKFTTSPTAPMTLSGTITMDPNAARVATRKGVRWTLTLNLMDENGKSLAGIFKEQLEEAISDREAQAFAIQSIEKLVRKDLAKKINDYMTSVALGK